MAGGLHGVGSSVVNALSEWLEVEVSREGHTYHQRFEKGKAVTDLKIIADTDETGTYIRFKPDPEIFTDTTEYAYTTLEKRMREQAFLNGGLKISLTDKRDEEAIVSEVFHYEGGISEFVTYNNRGKHPLHDEVIHLSLANGNSIAEIALQYTDSYSENILSFANNMLTVDGGTHEQGFKTALQNTLNGYARKFGLLKDANPDLKGEDCREGLTAIISVKLEDAQFESQTKAKLGNTEMRKLVGRLVKERLEPYLEENPAVARAILDKAIGAAAAREAAQKARERERKKVGIMNTRMPDKLSDCILKDKERTELYIVEGDSAGGSAIQGRDSNFQAILSLWGKMLNVEKARADKVYGNDKLNPVIVALGCGIGEDFDLSKLRYGKVIIMADADVDGAHISTLLMTFFFRYMKPLIENGHVYIAQPPLFKVSKSGKNVHYAYTEEERDRYIAELGGSADVQRYKGLGEMDPEQLWETTMDPAVRSMIQVTIEDAQAADATISVLMGDQVEPRRLFIEQNAKYATNLDF